MPEAPRHPVLLAVRSALPPPVAQHVVRDEVALRLWPHLAGHRHLAMFDNAGIEQRHLAMPLGWYTVPHAARRREEAANRLGAEHGLAAARSVLGAAAVDPGDVDALVFVSTTSLRSPNLDVDLVDRLGLRDDVRRVPVFGTASLGGAVGLGLAADLVRAGQRLVLVVAAEMSSTTFAPGDGGPADLVNVALFSDGAAALLVGADRHDDRALSLVGRSSTLVPDSVGVMGFDPADEGLRWRLSPDVPDVARTALPPSVAAAAASQGWVPADLDHLVLHPGGARVLDACRDALGVDEAAVAWSRRSLAAHGNVSAVSLLVALEEFLRAGPPPGRGLATAMGPGFGIEHVLFEAGGT